MSPQSRSLYFRRQSLEQAFHLRVPLVLAAYSPYMPTYSTCGCLTYPPDCAHSKGRHIAPTIAPSFGIGPIIAQKLLQQLRGAFAGQWGNL
jgi:hypothetical protein